MSELYPNEDRKILFFCDRAIGGADIETSRIYKIVKLYLRLFHLGEQKATSKWQTFSHI